MDEPALTIVIPTRDRHEELLGAVRSALGQTLTGVEVIVVDDASEPPVELEPRGRLRRLRLDRRSGVSAARNAGLAAARGRYVTFLDDDNRLLPEMAAKSLAAIAEAALPPPVAAVSGVEVIGAGGRVLDRRIPPRAHPRGDHFSLEPLPPGRSHMTKQTLVAETHLLRSLGGYDVGLPSRELSDLLLRLNPVCSIVGVPDVTYQLTRTRGSRLSRDTRALEQGFSRFVDKHRDLLATHPSGYADALLGHARMSLVAGPRRAAAPSIARAFMVAPGRTSRVLMSPRRMAAAVRTWKSSG